MKITAKLLLTTLMASMLTGTLCLVAAEPGKPAKADAARPRPLADAGKRRIERPVEAVIAGKNINIVPKAATDGRAVAHRKATPSANLAKDKSAKSESASTFKNPRVEPGKVRWHKDFDAAKAASKKSGNPVLLFQMIGKLDERFC